MPTKDNYDFLNHNVIRRYKVKDKKKDLWLHWYTENKDKR